MNELSLDWSRKMEKIFRHFLALFSFFVDMSWANGERSFCQVEVKGSSSNGEEKIPGKSANSSIGVWKARK